MLGKKFTIIGVIEEEGDNPFNFLQFDDVVWMSLTSMQKYFKVGRPYGNSAGGQLLAVKVCSVCVVISV